MTIQMSARAAAQDATERQLRFIATLAAERGVAADPVITKGEASEEIERLLALPKVTAPAPAPVIAAPAADEKPWEKIERLLADIPDGRYALPGTEVDSYLFFRLRTWRGRRYFDGIVGSGYGHGFNKVRRPWSVMTTSAERIATDPLEAAQRFATHHGVCARCLAPLTDPVSVAAGLGPECRTHWAGRI